MIRFLETLRARRCWARQARWNRTWIRWAEQAERG